MRMRLVVLTLTCALAAGLIACQSEPAPTRVVSSQSTSLGPVESPERCPSDDGGFGADVRHLGQTTPWSENPFLNPCWPN